jgi:DNA modification methylase
MATTTQDLFNAKKDATAQGPVECLGMTFPNDEARRQYFMEKLREKLKDPAFREIEGFPIGEDEDILALSDPPYYTACPNPFLQDVVAFHNRASAPQKPYHREPFATDVSEGKTDAVYKAHSYHTKVPHKAIMRYILHFTEPGAVVFDGFCGTGMAGIAAQMCASPDASFKADLDSHAKAQALDVKWGERLAFLNELSPLASFISHNYTRTVSRERFEEALAYFFSELDNRLSRLYSTKHTNGRAGRINYVVWSEIFFCQDCGQEVVFLQEAMDEDRGSVARAFNCPHCNAIVSKRSMSRAFESFFDRINSRTCSRVKRVPVLINYSVDGIVCEKAPDKGDFDLLRQVDSEAPAAFFPAIEMPFMHVTHIKDKMSNFGISHFSHFFLPRSQHALAHMWEIACSHPEPQLRHALLFMVEQCNWTMSLFNRYRPAGYSQVNQYMSGVYFIPSTTSEVSPWYVLEGKSHRLAAVFQLLNGGSPVYVSTGSGSNLTLPDESIDYIFTDPPFGENLQYSELNWLVESFHRVTTNNKAEAVVNKAQKKELLEYLDLMLSCFRENFRVLKPGHWMTVEFHNSKNSIWNAIQEAMLRAGFVVADVRMLDKQGETYKQSKQRVVKADLIISAYKPDTTLEEQFRLHAGTVNAAWEFARSHLSHLLHCCVLGSKRQTVTLP